MMVAIGVARSAHEDKEGVGFRGGLYLLARGTRYAPIVGLYFGFEIIDELEKTLEVFFESAEIPGAGTEKVALIDPADLPGAWSFSRSSPNGA